VCSVYSSTAVFPDIIFRSENGSASATNVVVLVVDAAPSLGVYYFFVVDSVCLWICHTPSNCFFFFVSLWNRAILGRQFSMTPSTKHCSSIFDLGPLTPKIDSPKFGLKSPISQLVWQIDRRCLRLPGGFRGWPIHWNHAKCCGAALCCHDNKIWARRGVQSPTGLLLGLLLSDLQSAKAFSFHNRSSPNFAYR